MKRILSTLITLERALMGRVFAAGRALAWLVIIGAASAAMQRAAGAGAAADPGPFPLIGQRNIFSAERSSRSSRVSTPPRAARVETCTLVGTLLYDQGCYAFFDSSHPDLPKVLEPGGTIGDFRILAVHGTGLTLEKAGKAVDLQVGMQLRRENEGDWHVAAPGGQSAAKSGPGEIPGDEDDTVKRLMQQREQELQ